MNAHKLQFIQLFLHHFGTSEDIFLLSLELVPPSKVPSLYLRKSETFNKFPLLNNISLYIVVLSFFSSFKVSRLVLNSLK